VCVTYSEPGTYLSTGQGLLIIEASQSHSDTPQSLGILWTSDQLVAETSDNTHNPHKRQTSMPLAGFKPAATASDQPRVHALDRGSTGISTLILQKDNGRIRVRLPDLTLYRAVHTDPASNELNYQFNGCRLPFTRIRRLEHDTITSI
jgi:hypothetical protein